VDFAKRASPRRPPHPHSHNHACPYRASSPRPSGACSRGRPAGTAPGSNQTAPRSCRPGGSGCPPRRLSGQSSARRAAAARWRGRCGSPGRRGGAKRPTVLKPPVMNVLVHCCRAIITSPSTWTSLALMGMGCGYIAYRWDWENGEEGRRTCR
jgi:hypothetical protein